MYSLKKVYGFIALILLALAVAGCSDELVVNDGAKSEAALDTKVKIKVVIPEVDVKSRAEGELSTRINNLWIGVYNVGSGKRTATKLYNFDTENVNISNHGTTKEIELICKSGLSYIVAVANVKSEVFKVGKFKEGDATNGNSFENSGSLYDDLVAADTWDKYRSIVLQQVTFGDINMPSPPEGQGLVMPGMFIANTESATGLEHANGTLEIVPFEIRYSGNVETAVELAGAIHLRRPVSKITFNIKCDKEKLDYFNLTDIHLVNVPNSSWLLERTGDMDYETGVPTDESPLNRTNSGDALAGIYDKLSDWYSESPETPPTAMDPQLVKPGENYSASFWMFENRHTGLNSCTDYKNREWEWSENLKNTGIYRSLSQEGGTVNNSATYAIISGELKYKDGTITMPNGSELPENTQRVASVEYFVHLGYVNPDKNPRDFNSMRNAEYTYNVTVKGVDNIVTEAYMKDIDECPIQPGAEGIVTDLTNSPIEIDAHYAAFNIYLSKKELEDCRFSMISYYGNDIHSYGNAKESDTYPKEGDSEWQFYNWVELIQTTGENDLALYPLAENRGNILHLADLKYESEKLNSDEEGRWYTVFVNENTYDEAAPNESEGTTWHNYVNQPDRRFWIHVEESVSPDGLSTHRKAKYEISQKSIQTYYDLNSGTAVGIEHTNENFGMNNAWTISLSLTELNPDNGRYNVWKVVEGNEESKNWSGYVDFGEPQNVNEINNTIQIEAAGISGAKKTWQVPKVKLLTGYKNTNDLNVPQTGENQQWYQTLSGCMNRNRDLNGNGTIEPNEMRWFVPSSGEYVRAILGRNSLSTPIMSYTASHLAYPSGDDRNTMYHYFASDKKFLWCEEGMSSAEINNKYNSWQVRCIRNLGTNLYTVASTNQVEQAYDDTDINSTTKGGVVKVRHYLAPTLRGGQSGPLPMHKSNELFNRIASYGFEIAPRGNDTKKNSEKETSVTSSLYWATFEIYKEWVKQAKPCDELNNNSGRTGWRIPNQKELVIMRRMDGAKLLLPDSQQDAGFMSCTQEYWAFSYTGGSCPKNEEGEVITDYYELTPDFSPAYASFETNRYFRILTVRLKIATALRYPACWYVRCVRDLTAQERNMSYDQILQYKDH